MKLLLVDDDPLSLTVLEAELRALGHECLRAESGPVALDLIAVYGIRIVISDWIMPGMDGLELCRRVRQLPDYVVFILLTQMESTRTNKENAIQAGVDDFLRKPVDPHELWLRLHVAERVVSFSRRVAHLESIIPICSYCRKVRDDRNYWQQIERYLSEQTGAALSHSICPHCFDTIVEPEMRRLGIRVPPKPPLRVDRVD